MGVQKRSLGMYVGLSIITFGLYWIYTTHQYHTEFADESQLDSGMSPVVRTVLLFLPPISLYSYWLFFKDVETLTGDSAVKNFVLSFVLVGWILAVSSLNDYAG